MEFGLFKVSNKLNLSAYKIDLKSFKKVETKTR